MTRQNISDGTSFEPVFGYSRAVKVDNQVFVSGTVGWHADGTFDASDDVYTQTRNAIGNVEKALRQAGATLADVVRTRVYILDGDAVMDVARAHLEAFDAVRPATALIVVKQLLTDGMLVEIEADAVIS